jgi:hypothetical protein
MNARYFLLLPGLCGGLALSASAATSGDHAAAKPATAGNPYVALVSRNVFGLVPIPEVDPASLVPATPPPKITPNGIMTLFGKLQVLFKVQVPAAGGQPARELSYTMSEGERQDEIEVQRIDEQAATITFNNHGTVQTLELAKAAAGPPAGVPAAGRLPAGAMPRPAGAVAMAHQAGASGSLSSGAGGRFGRNHSATANTAASQSGAGMAGLGMGGAGAGNAGDSDAEQLSPEAQVIMIEANRMATQELVDKGFMPPLPPTPLTPEDATAHDGAPLIAPSEPLDPNPKK